MKEKCSDRASYEVLGIWYSISFNGGSFFIRLFAVSRFTDDAIDLAQSLVVLVNITIALTHSTNMLPKNFRRTRDWLCNLVSLGKRNWYDKRQNHEGIQSPKSIVHGSIVNDRGIYAFTYTLIYLEIYTRN